jgi:transcriptional regulator
VYAHPAYRFDRAAALLFASARGFGTVVAYDGKKPIASPLPFQLAYRMDGTPTVCFHVARNNPLAALSGQGGNWLIAVSGADAYVSPAWYVSPQQVPTWLYETVHLSGPVQPVSGARRLDHLNRLTEQFEQPEDGAPAWTSARLAAPRRDAMLDAIAVIEMDVEDVEGVAKLNQTKSDADFRAVTMRLATHADEMARRISARMIALRPNLSYEKTEEDMPHG